MPRSFVIGNGNLLVGYDANYDVRDLFFPYVGMENQTVGNVCRTGFWIDGKFAWVGDPAWKRQIGYWGDTLPSGLVFDATSPGPAYAHRRRAIVTSTSSPAECPNTSLICLKSSTSSTTATRGCCVRSATSSAPRW